MIDVEATVERLCTAVERRQDGSVADLATLLAMWRRELVPQRQQVRVQAAVLGFRYWLDEPGTDSMRLWREDQQLLAAACEHVAGLTFPTEHVGGLNLLGIQCRERGEERASHWLDARLAHGFSAWHSPDPLLRTAAGLALLADESDEPVLAARAAAALDLCLLDIALYSFDGTYVAPGAQVSEADAKHPSRADISALVRHVAGTPGPAPEPGDLAWLVTSSQHEVPAVVRAIAHDGGSSIIRTSDGMDVADAVAALKDQPDVEAAAYLWGMGAMAHPRALDATLHAWREWNVSGNDHLRDLAGLVRFSGVPGLGRSLPMQMALRVTKPVAVSQATQRGDVEMFRTPNYALAAVVDHHPGDFGAEELIWRAILPGGISVFANHPRVGAESAWVGNGKQPRVGMRGNLLLAHYDATGRRGLGEAGRAHLSHLHFPFARFDETRLGPTWVAGRVEDSFVGVVALGTLEMVGTHELVQRGAITGWGVVMGDVLDFPQLRDLVAIVKESALSLDGTTLTFSSPFAQLQSRWRKGFFVDGRRQVRNRARYDTPWVKAGPDASVLEIGCGEHLLVLDLVSGASEQRLR